DALPQFQELIEHLSALGNRTQMWTLLRSLIHLLAKEGHHENAAVLHGALQASTTSGAPFGADHERLLQVAQLIEASHEATVVERWYERGAAMMDDEAIGFALAAIRSAREPPIPAIRDDRVAPSPHD